MSPGPDRTPSTCVADASVLVKLFLDAAYLALAAHLAVPLLTADLSLIREADGSGISVRHLASFADAGESGS